MIDHCSDCPGTMDDVNWGPMLFGDVWLKLADAREFLCFDCLLARAEARGIKLTIASLKPCPINFCGSASPFAYFMRGQTMPPPNFKQWQEAAVRHATFSNSTGGGTKTND